MSDSDPPASTLGRPAVVINNLTLSDTLLKFLALLEERMLAGYSRWSNKRWAKEELGVSDEVFNKSYHILRTSWKERLWGDTINDQRDGVRAMFVDVYKRAIEQNKLDTAIKVLHELVELDGLAATPSMNLNIAPQITNAPREEFANIVDRIGKLMSSKTVAMLRDVESPQERPTGQDPVTKNGHTNGHHKIIDVPDDEGEK